MFGTTHRGEAAFNTYYLSDLATGNMTLFSAARPWSDAYSLLLGSGKTTNTFFPQIEGGRIYISVGKPLSVKTNSVAIPDAISADNPGSEDNKQGNPNYYKIWDFIEMSWTIESTDPFHSTLGGNVTQVDAFGLTFELDRAGLKDDFKTTTTIKEGFTLSGARQQILKELDAAGEPWTKLLVRDGKGTVYRALQPVKGIDQKIFSNPDLVNYVELVAKKYPSSASKDKWMQLKPEGVPYYGACAAIDNVGFHFIFEPADSKTGASYKIHLRRDECAHRIYGNSIEWFPSAGPAGGRGGVIARDLGASFCRSTLLTDSTVPVPQERRSQYFVNKPIFEYGRIIHKYAYENHAFTFGYDEVAQDAGLCCLKNPTSLTLTLHPL